MRDTRPIISRLEIARRVWAASDVNIPNDNVEDLVNGGFVLRAAEQASLQANLRASLRADRPAEAA